MKDKIDAKKIELMFAEIARYRNDLERIGQIKNEKDLDSTKFHAISMLLLSITNKVIDIGEEIVAAKSLGVPSSYRDVFVILEKNRFIGKSLANGLQILAKNRNILAHEYGSINEKNIIFLLRKIRVVEEFQKIVKKEIKK
jgi:uncharacterized protein YutE (UPF0331/DUF86 family)